ncbi:MAG TPA: type IV toxin-antitoxin system AbiEi family antitoxin [Acidimicrobiales bacterium]|nr:type IV toxin-antitoxin system AbiEi family antitoxin [Acidimicrobiales bacterium]
MRDTGDRWTRTDLAAAEAILSGVEPTVETVERTTGFSRGAVTNTLARLERRGLLERPSPGRGRGVARRLADPDKLIDEYADAARDFRMKQRVVRLHRLWTDPLAALASEIGPAFGETGARWAVSGAAASTLLAPYLSDVNVLDLYVERDLFSNPDELGDVIGARIVDKGHRLEVRELPTPSSEAGPKIGNVQVALPARVYADLMSSGGRFAEAAHHLREVRGVGPGA